MATGISRSTSMLKNRRSSRSSRRRPPAAPRRGAGRRGGREAELVGRPAVLLQRQTGLMASLRSSTTSSTRRFWSSDRGVEHFGADLDRHARHGTARFEGDFLHGHVAARAAVAIDEDHRNLPRLLLFAVGFLAANRLPRFRPPFRPPSSTPPRRPAGYR